MGTGYVRTDTTDNIATGKVVNASDLDAEFDAIESTLSTSGHTHDGTAAEGGPVTVVGPAQDLVVSITDVLPKVTNTLDLGSATFQFKDLYLDGIAYIDGLGQNTLLATDKQLQFRDTDLSIYSSADGQLDIVADTELQIVAPTLDINAATAVTIDTTTLTMTASANIVGDLDVDNLNLNGNTITSTNTNGNIDLAPNGTGEVNITKVDIDSGAIDGTTIGAASAAAGTFTNLIASGTVNLTGATVTSLGTVATMDLNGGTIDGAAVGASSASTGRFTTLTTTGDFTSLGIDDNATSEVLQLADTVADWGQSGANFFHFHTVDTQIHWFGGGNTSTSGAGFRLYGGAAANQSRLDVVQDSVNRIRIDDSDLTADIIFYNSAGTEKWRFDQSAGAVLIGTTAPIGSELLHVKGISYVAPLVGEGNPTLDSQTTAVFQRNFSSSYLNKVAIISGTLASSELGFGDFNDQNAGTIIYDNSDDSFRIGTNASEAVRLTSSGAVIIGTTAPSGSELLRVNGEARVDGALAVLGAFTSLGIDDNAAAECFQLSETLADWGVAGTGFNHVHTASDQFIILSGGSTASLGGNILYYGESHSSRANDILIRRNTTTTALFDGPTGDITFYRDDGSTVGMFFDASSGDLTVNGLFTSAGIDDNATTEVFQLSNANATLGTASSSFTLQHSATDASVFLSGGSAASNGGNIVLFGQSHSASSEIRLRQSAINRIVIDDTAATGDIIFHDSAGTEKWRFDQSTGSVLIGTTAPASTELFRVNGSVYIGGSTEDIHIKDAGSTSATEQDWIEVTVGGVTGYIRVYATK